MKNKKDQTQDKEAGQSPAFRLIWIFVMLAAAVMGLAGGCAAPSRPAEAGPSWSDPVDGLCARIETPMVDLAQPDEDIFVRLKNTGNQPLTVPVNSSEGHFALQAGSQGVWQTVLWVASQFGAEKGVDSSGPPAGLFGNPASRPSPPEPTVVLKPGESVLCELPSGDYDALHAADDLRVTLTVAKASAAGDWIGTLTTPPRAIRISEADSSAMTGTLPLPEHLPPFGQGHGVGGNISGNESAVKLLGWSHWQWLSQLEIYRPDQVRGFFEEAMDSQADPDVKLLFAAEAAARGSGRGKDFLLDQRKSVKYSEALNVLDAIGRVARAEHPPDWVVDAMLEALNDTRQADISGTNISSQSHFSIGYMADEEAEFTWILGDMKSRRAVPALIELVKSTNDARGPIIALGEIGDERAIPVLIDVIQRHEEDIVVASGGLEPESVDSAILALGNMKSREAVDLLLKHVCQEDVVEALESIGDPRAIPTLEKIVADNRPQQVQGSDAESNRDAVAAAKIALATLQPGDPIPRYWALARDMSLGEFSRRQAIWRLGRHPDPRSVPVLLEAARNDPSGTVVDNAIEMLGLHRYKASVPALIECLNANFRDKQNWKYAYTPQMFQDHVVDALRKLTGQSFGPDAEKWRNWWQSKGQADSSLE